MKKAFFLAAKLCCLFAGAQKKIIIQGKFPPDYSGIIQFSIVPYYTELQYSSDTGIAVKNGTVKWVINADKPLRVWSDKAFGKPPHHLAEPSDSIHIEFNGQTPVFSGKGAAKFQLIHEIEKVKNSLPSPSNAYEMTIRSLHDFYEWNAYLDRQLDLVVPLVDSYRNKLSPFIYNEIKLQAVARIENARYTKFHTMKDYGSGFGISEKDICTAFDSIITRWPKKLSPYLGVNLYNVATQICRYEKLLMLREFNFNKNAEAVSTKSGRDKRLYALLKNKYTGRFRDFLLATHVTKSAIDEGGFSMETESMLKDFYACVSDPEIKKLVMDYEGQARVKTLKPGYPAPDFRLETKDGRVITKKDIDSRFAVLVFQQPGKPIGVDAASRSFAGDTGITFLNVSTGNDKEKWKEAVREINYPQQVIPVFGGVEYFSDLKRSYNLGSLPAVFLIDNSGRLISTPVSSLDSSLTAMIKKQRQKTERQQMEQSYDGPYVFAGTRKTAWYIHKQEKIKSETGRRMQVQTDQQEKTFEVILKDSLQPEPSEYPRPSRVFLLSDIEGNFEAFRKLLMSNGVIDTSYRWTFGDGHLVLAGDFFDRGEQVTECLWLIYSLEDKAKAAGGYVHFIIGNHEVMNLSGDTRYVKPKYIRNAALMNMPYQSLYNRDSELGRWLRTKNIVEKIGELLVVHGGISREVNNLNISISQLNELARPFFDKSNVAEKSGDVRIRTLYSSQTSPFWLRSYYSLKDTVRMIGANKVDTIIKTTMRDLDNTLNKFGVNRIITGHTIAADIITAHYSNKVINIDVHHASGKSEALYIEHGRYYRVNGKGEKMLLFE